MTQTQHTPGPLRYDAESSTIQSQGAWTDTDTGERHVDWSYPRIHAHMVEDWDEKTLGLLFAAAPDLLKSLQWAVGMALEAILVREAGDDEADTPDIIAMHREALAEANAAIAKARGEDSLIAASEGFNCNGCGRPEADCSADPCPAVIADREA